MRSKFVVLSFDDGLAIHYDIAKYLSSIDIEASFLIPVVAIDKTLSEKQLSDIMKIRHELMSHGIYHRDLTKIANDEELLFGLKHSKEISETYQNKVLGIDYPPYGRYDNRVLNHIFKILLLC